ncbi:leucine-rich repeat protein [Tanacetum coccineum]
MTCSIQERHALLKFKNSVKDNDGILSSWVGNDCCQWEGVHCDGATGSVVGLHLRHKVSEPSYGDTVGVELFGEDYYIPSNAFDVREKHQLVGDTVNSCLAKLRHLKYLDLSGNYFGGRQIPEFIGSFKKLSYLNLSHAGFTGIIPHHIGNLSNLKVLDLSRLEPVTVDDMSWVSGLSSLEHLNLTGVNLRRVQNIDSTKLANIRHLDLSWNKIESQLPVFLQNVTSLAFLDLSGSNLSLIWNSANMLSVFPSLSELRLSTCGLKNINLNFSEHSNIQHLCLSNNDFRGRFPYFLANMSSLLSLDLSNNDFNSSIPVMRRFLKLDLSSNGIRKIKYVGIWRQCHLKELILSNNYFDEELVGSSTNVSECSQYALERLNLGTNYLHGPIPEALGTLRSLQVLDISANKLTGSVPEALGKLRHLQSLNLSSNLLKGPIPKFQGELSKLHLDHNKFNGSIPESFGKLSGLTELCLQSNQLGGPIPVSLGRLTSLQVFSVSSNFLNGAIPVSFRKLSRLGYIDVFNNSLGGMV